MIRIENIGKVFNPRSRNRNEVLKGVSFELPEKGLVAHLRQKRFGQNDAFEHYRRSG